MKILCLALPVFALAAAAAEPALSPGLSPGFEHFYNLEYPQAIEYFRGEIAREPNNPEVYNHLAQAVLYQEMFRGGALESEMVSGSNPFIRREKLNTTPEAAKTFDDCIGKAISLSQARIDKNSRDVPALYALGVAYGLRANYNFLVRKAWMDSLKDATASRKAHNRVIEIDPNFIDARLVQGVHDYVVGSLPWHIKLLGFLAGFHGDKETGMKNLQLVAEKGNINRYDARVLLAVIYRREHKPLQALPLLSGLSDRFPRNYLFRLEMVQMYSDAGNKTAALEVLDKIEAMKKANTPTFAALPLEKIWYYRGNLLFWYREYDAAIECLRRVTPHTTKLDLHTAAMSWMRLGQSLDMKGRRNEAKEAYQQAINAAPETEAAKESRGYLSSKYQRNG